MQRIHAARRPLGRVALHLLRGVGPIARLLLHGGFLLATTQLFLVGQEAGEFLFALLARLDGVLVGRGLGFASVLHRLDALVERRADRLYLALFGVDGCIDAGVGALALGRQERRFEFGVLLAQRLRFVCIINRRLRRQAFVLALLVFLVVLEARRAGFHARIFLLQRLHGVGVRVGVAGQVPDGGRSLLIERLFTLLGEADALDERLFFLARRQELHQVVERALLATADVELGFPIHLIDAPTRQRVIALAIDRRGAILGVFATLERLALARIFAVVQVAAHPHLDDFLAGLIHVVRLAGHQRVELQLLDVGLGVGGVELAGESVLPNVLRGTAGSALGEQIVSILDRVLRRVGLFALRFFFRGLAVHRRDGLIFIDRRLVQARFGGDEHAFLVVG